jgi:hypothetical protein
MMHLTRRSALTLFGALGIHPKWASASPKIQLRVHKDPNCGCCTGWADHLEAAGFAVDMRPTANLATIRKKLGVPDNLAACHTAEVEGYLIEGHVPAVAIHRLLSQRPEAAGLAVPGMPPGSPGMESDRSQPYHVTLFGKNGQRLFMQFNGVTPIE